MSILYSSISPFRHWTYNSCTVSPHWVHNEPNKMINTKIKNPDRIKDKQDQIIRGALKVFRKKGFHAASIREIAKACKISIGSLYDYIEKKEDILFLVHNNILDILSCKYDEAIKDYDDPAGQLLNAFRETFYLTNQMKEEVLFVYTESKSLKKSYLREILKREAEYVNKSKTLIEQGIKKGIFKCKHSDLVANFFTYIGAIVPLRGWNMLPNHEPEKILEEFLEIIKEQKHSRYPVYSKDLDNITGFVHAKDLLRIKPEKMTIPIQVLLRKPTFVYSDNNALSVFLLLKKNKTHIATVKDKKGKTVGIVTMEDILEELFGEIKDETDMEDESDV